MADPMGNSGIRASDSGHRGLRCQELRVVNQVVTTANRESGIRKQDLGSILPRMAFAPPPVQVLNGGAIATGCCKLESSLECIAFAPPPVSVLNGGAIAAMGCK